MSRIFTTGFASVYPLYLTKVEREGRTKAELDQVIGWLTGFDDPALNGHLTAGSTLEDFFAGARLNPHASLITGVVCGVRVERIDDPLMQLMQKIRYKGGRTAVLVAVDGRPAGVIGLADAARETPRWPSRRCTSWGSRWSCSAGTTRPPRAGSRASWASTPSSPRTAGSTTPTG